MNHPESTHDTTQGFHYSEDDNSPEAIMERMNAIYGRSNYDELKALFNDETRHEDYNELLDELAEKVLNENEEFLDNGKKMRSGLSPERQKEVKKRQLELLHEAREIICQEAGLSAESSLSDIEVAKNNVRDIIAEALEADGTAGSDELLHALGILDTTRSDKEHFVYPTKLFPRSTNAKWNIYIHTVREHLKAVDDLEKKNPSASIEQVQEADRFRRLAHDRVSREVDDILGLEALPDSKWDFEKTRNLLAKMRDTRFPNQNTAEKFLTEKILVEAALGKSALKALIAKRTTH